MGLTKADLSGEGTIPLVRDQLIMSVIAGTRDGQTFRRTVGRASKLHDFGDDL